MQDIGIKVRVMNSAESDGKEHGILNGSWVSVRVA